METEKTQNILPKFFCDNCDFKCLNKSEWNRHISTSKHKKKTDGNILETEKTVKNIFTCEFCNKIYNNRSGIWKHTKKCNPNNIIETDENKIVDVMTDQNYLLIEQNKQLLEQHLDLKSMIIDICKNMNVNNNTINNTNNSHNKTFNLQVFLNETCKDAMNLTDFVDSLQIQLSDLENVGKNGFVAGISNIIMKNLKALDVTQRPVHCSDQKRETIYIKDKDQWHNDSKELPENQKLKKAIKQIVHKNICMIPEWKKKYPDCIYAESKKSDLYNHIMYESMDHNESNSEKIIKKIAKEVAIEK
jgi:hypothetical protein